MKASQPLWSLAVCLLLAGRVAAGWDGLPGTIPAEHCDSPGSRLGPLPTMFGDLLQPSPALPMMRFVDFGGIVVEIPSFFGPLKVAENESPRPQRRVYVHYSNFADVAGTVDSVNREIFGIEWAWNEHFSFGARTPYVQQDSGIIDDTAVDDLSILFKWAPINEENRVYAIGLDLTVPTGSEPVIWFADGNNLHPVWFQFFFGYYRAWDNCFLHGFTSLAVPSDSRQPTLLFNDMGLGYWIRREGGLIRAVVPTFEAHLNLPLDQPNLEDILDYRTSVNLTLGATVFFGDHCSLGAAAAVPVVGPLPFKMEGIASFNWRF